MVPDFLNSFLSVFDNIPEYHIAITVYYGGSLLVLWLWYLIAKSLPKPLGGMTWIFLFAILLAPTISEGVNAKIAPATVGLLVGIITHEDKLIWANLIPILFVAALGFFLGYLWNKYQDHRNTIAG